MAEPLLGDVSRMNGELLPINNQMYRLEVSVFILDFTHHPTEVGWNLGWERKLPTPAEMALPEFGVCAGIQIHPEVYWAILRRRPSSLNLASCRANYHWFHTSNSYCTNTRAICANNVINDTKTCPEQPPLKETTVLFPPITSNCKLVTSTLPWQVELIWWGGGGMMAWSLSSL